MHVSAVAVTCPHCNTRLVNQSGHDHNDGLYAPPGKTRCPQCKEPIAFPNLTPIWCNTELVQAALREPFTLPDGSVIPGQGEPTKKRARFTTRQIRMFVDQCISVSVGSSQGWRFIGREMQQAIVLARVARIIASQDEGSTFTSADVQNLIDRMLYVAKLGDV